MKETIKVEIQAPQYTVDQDVTFAQVDAWYGHVTRDLKMDIIYPEDATRNYPCIVWICGGAWLRMDVGAHLAYLSQLARAGFVVASVEYRTSNEVEFPGALEDIKAGIRYQKAHAKRYHIDTEHFGVMGESAGGHLTAMTALTGKEKIYDKGAYLEYSSEVQAACPWYVPSDISAIPGQELREMASSPESLLVGVNVVKDPDKAKAASPVYQVKKDAPPFLLIHGTQDRTVPFEQSELLYDALEKEGVPVDLLALEGADHADLAFFQNEIWERIIKFFRDTLVK